LTLAVVGRNDLAFEVIDLRNFEDLLLLLPDVALSILTQYSQYSICLLQIHDGTHAIIYALEIFNHRQLLPVLTDLHGSGLLGWESSTNSFVIEFADCSWSGLE
tara:strand:+ start:573 stop:884 length:312 start_codon:yes stop_codon:yes gene_type:complete